MCRDTNIIALTGNTISGARRMYQEQGFDGYVEKPIQGKLLEREILNVLPRDILEYRSETEKALPISNRIQEISRNRRKRICITSDCACDLPVELLEKYGIDIMYLYIKTPHGRFADTREIDSDNLTQFVSKENSLATADSVTMEEYEEFFAETLTKAEQVIHFTVSSRCGGSYTVAVKAAKGFDHVRVIDSQQLSLRPKSAISFSCILWEK